MEKEIITLVYDKLFNNHLTDRQQGLYHDIGEACVRTDDGDIHIILGTEDRTYKLSIEDITGEL